MKMQGHNNKLETNVVGHTKNFGIGNAAKIIAILRDKMYEHKVRTLCQEYICNARDAMREVGKDNSFEVTVPTRLNPVFKVRDFGPGITPDRMENIFTMYGSSTKEDTNDQTGGFGIGAKSAWSYTDSFTIVSVTDGVRRTYVAHTGTDNNGRLDLISADDTDDATGTEIQVAVKSGDMEEFRKSIFRAIYFWPQKPTLKGELDVPPLVQGDRISDLVEVVDRQLLPEYVQRGSYYGSNDILAVIDGIVYKINDKLIDKIKKLKDVKTLLSKSLILHFGNGIVELAASRETIADCQNTTYALEKLGAKAFLEVQTYITNKFGAVKNNTEYLQTYAELSKSYSVDKYAKFGEYRIDHGSITSPLLQSVQMLYISKLNAHGRRIEKVTKEYLTGAQRQIEIKELDNLFYLSADETKIQQGKRIRAYLETRNTMIVITPSLEQWNTPMVPGPNGQDLVKGTPTRLGLHQKDLDKAYQQVLKDLAVKDFSSITYVELPKELKAIVKREKEVFCYHTTGYGRHNYTTLGQNTKKWFYVILKDGAFPYDKRELSQLEDYLEIAENASICGLAASTAKNVVGDPNYHSLGDWLANFKPGKDNILAQNKANAANEEVCESLKNVTGIADPFLAGMIEEYKEIAKSKGRAPCEILAQKISLEKDVIDFKARDKKLTEVLKSDYPLLSEAYDNCKNKNELVVYINAKFKAKKGKK